MPVHEPRLGVPAFRTGGRVEQPLFELDLRRHGPRRIDAHLLPQFLDGPPVAQEPAAVLVGPVALRLPPRAGREEMRVVRHVELGGVTDAPAVGSLVADQHGVGVDLLQDLQVALRLDLENRAALRTELLDLRQGVGRGEVAGALPVVQVAAHEGGADRGGGAAFLDDDGVELVAAVDREDLVTILDAEQPFPPAAFQEQVPQCAGAVVRVQAGGNDESEPAAPPIGGSGPCAILWRRRLLQQRVGGLEEQLVEVEIRRSLMAERMGGVAETGGAGAGLPPAFVNLQVLAAPHDNEAILAAGVLLGVAEGARGVAREVRLRAEAGVVVEPVAFDGGIGEAGGLPV